jgi:hypothetical protein
LCVDGCLFRVAQQNNEQYDNATVPKKRTNTSPVQEPRRTIEVCAYAKGKNQERKIQRVPSFEPSGYLKVSESGENRTENRSYNRANYRFRW